MSVLLLLRGAAGYARGMTKLLRQIPWLAMQIAVVGFFLLVWHEREASGASSIPMGTALMVGVGIAFLLTALPIIAKDVIVGQWRFWASFARGRHASLRGEKRAGDAVPALGRHDPVSKVGLPGPGHHHAAHDRRGG